MINDFKNKQHLKKLPIEIRFISIEKKKATNYLIMQMKMNPEASITDRNSIHINQLNDVQLIESDNKIGAEKINEQIGEPLVKFGGAIRLQHAIDTVSIDDDEHPAKAILNRDIAKDLTTTKTSTILNFSVDRILSDSRCNATTSDTFQRSIPEPKHYVFGNDLKFKSNEFDSISRLIRPMPVRFAPNSASQLPGK